MRVWPQLTLWQSLRKQGMQQIKFGRLAIETCGSCGGTLGQSCARKEGHAPWELALSSAVQHSHTGNSLKAHSVSLHFPEVLGQNPLS